MTAVGKAVGKSTRIASHRGSLVDRDQLASSARSLTSLAGTTAAGVAGSFTKGLAMDALVKFAKAAILKV